MSGWVVAVEGGVASLATKVLEGQVLEHDRALNVGTYIP